MRRRPMGIQKHPPYSVPEGAPRNMLMKMSKAKLAEIVWDFAVQEAGGDEATEQAAIASVVTRLQVVSRS